MDEDGLKVDEDGLKVCYGCIDKQLQVIRAKNNLFDKKNGQNKIILLM